MKSTRTDVTISQHGKSVSVLVGEIVQGSIYGSVGLNYILFI